MNKLKRYLIFAAIFQVTILIGMLVKANLPLYFGTEIKVATKPIDPRSLFRGNFVRLNYDFTKIKTDKEFIKGEEIFLKLKKNKDNLFAYHSAWKKPPKGLYIQGRVEFVKFQQGILDQGARNTYIKFANIDAFFAPKEKALKLEKDLRKSAVAIIMVGKNGKMMLKDIIAE